MPSILEIFTCTDKGLPMESRDFVEVLSGIGIIDDRYGLGKGAWVKVRPQVIRHLSLIEHEAVADSGFYTNETRRNLVTHGISLNELVDQVFKIGNILVKGHELCTPCNRPSQLAGKKDFAEIFNNRGGLRVEVLNSGTIHVGDSIEIF